LCQFFVVEGKKPHVETALLQFGNLYRQNLHVPIGGLVVRNAVCLHLFRHFIKRLFDSGSSLFVRIVIREQSAPSAFYNDIYERYFKRVIHLLERLIRAITGCEEKYRLSMLAFSAFAQIIGSRLEKYVILKHSGIEEFSAKDIEQLATMITENAMLIVKQ
jgi:hypothetical protein